MAKEFSHYGIVVHRATVASNMLTELLGTFDHILTMDDKGYIEAAIACLKHFDCEQCQHTVDVEEKDLR